MNQLKLIPGDMIGGNILRSVNWEDRTVILENLDADPLDFYNRFETKRIDSLTGTGELSINIEYFKRYLKAITKYAHNRCTGRAKVSKACLKRLERQLQAINQQ